MKANEINFLSSFFFSNLLSIVASVNKLPHMFTAL